MRIGYARANALGPKLGSACMTANPNCAKADHALPSTGRSGTVMAEAGECAKWKLGLCQP